MTLQNQTATSFKHEENSFLPLEILVSAYEKPAGDCCFVTVAAFTHFKLSGYGMIPFFCFSKIISFSQTVNCCSCIHSLSLILASYRWEQGRTDMT
jgi:hypothetical protein